MEERRVACRCPWKLDDPDVHRYVREKQERLWSPGQIASRIARGFPRQCACWLSQQAIYNWIDQRAPDWRRWLRRQRWSPEKRGKMTDCVSTQGGGDVISHQRHHGDWEGVSDEHRAMELAGGMGGPSQQRILSCFGTGEFQPEFRIVRQNFDTGLNRRSGPLFVRNEIGRCKPRLLATAESYCPTQRVIRRLQRGRRLKLPSVQFDERVKLLHGTTEPSSHARSFAERCPVVRPGLMRENTVMAFLNPGGGPRFVGDRMPTKTTATAIANHVIRKLDRTIIVAALGSRWAYS
ncbi:MAG: hypothetical protein ABIP48_12780 [Planctomycetota bacterium]